uniref:Uncharacterized protein n=1 Tax=Arundo donax TaxID=35708 RepID=A0A0A8YCI5_ARUDO
MVSLLFVFAMWSTIALDCVLYPCT